MLDNQKPNTNISSLFCEKWYHRAKVTVCFAMIKLSTLVNFGGDKRQLFIFDDMLFKNTCCLDNTGNGLP